MRTNDGSSDWIVAVYPDTALTSQVRVELVSSGIATDRLDVISWDEPGRAAVVPAKDREDGLRKHFAMLFEGHEAAARTVEEVVAAVKSGDACLVVHPRGALEQRDVQQIIDMHFPRKQYLSLTAPAQQGGLLGEHAAG